MRRDSGYSLVEISTVLIVAALFLTATALGVSLYKTSRNSMQINQLSQYAAAYGTFVSVYDAVPGDMINADTILGSSCNGNGDGWISCCNIWFGENVNVSNHLSLAKLVPGSYTCGGSPSLGSNISRGAYSSSAALWFQNNNHWGVYASTNNINITGIGGSDYPVVSVNDARAIDIKIDDGLPGTGILMSYNAANPGTCSNFSLEGIGFGWGGTNDSVIPSNQAYVSGNGTCVLNYGLLGYKFMGKGF
jgi:hypothetical protein